MTAVTSSSKNARLSRKDLIIFSLLAVIMVRQVLLEHQWALSSPSSVIVSSAGSGMIPIPPRALDGEGGDDAVVAKTMLLEEQGTRAIGYDFKVNPLAIPPGQAPNLPSIRVQDESDQVQRHGYGGRGDKAHLGGFAKMDHGGISPHLFKKMISDYGVHSFLDIGCGRGFSTSWFAMHGCDVLCIEGSHDGVSRSVLPQPERQVIEHDFSRGPFWPAKTYDVAWSVEFLEHVLVEYQVNYVAAMRKAAIIMVTSSMNIGWHHVEGKFYPLFAYLFRHTHTHTHARGCGVLPQTILTVISKLVAPISYSYYYHTSARQRMVDSQIRKLRIPIQPRAYQSSPELGQGGQKDVHRTHGTVLGRFLHSRQHESLYQSNRGRITRTRAFVPRTGMRPQEQDARDPSRMRPQQPRKPGVREDETVGLDRRNGHTVD